MASVCLASAAAPVKIGNRHATVRFGNVPMPRKCYKATADYATAQAADRRPATTIAAQ